MVWFWIPSGVYQCLFPCFEELSKTSYLRHQTLWAAYSQNAINVGHCYWNDPTVGGNYKADETYCAILLTSILACSCSLQLDSSKLPSLLIPEALQLAVLHGDTKKRCVLHLFWALWKTLFIGDTAFLTSFFLPSSNTEAGKIKYNFLLTPLQLEVSESFNIVPT